MKSIKVNEIYLILSMYYNNISKYGQSDITSTVSFFLYKILNLDLAHFRTYVHLTEKTRNQIRIKINLTKDNKARIKLKFTLT